MTFHVYLILSSVLVIISNSKVGNFEKLLLPLFTAQTLKIRQLTFVERLFLQFYNVTDTKYTANT